jgi:hypothetical protein
VKWPKLRKKVRKEEEETEDTKKPSRLKGWYSSTKQKRLEKKKKEQEKKESTTIKIFTVILTLITMAIAFSILPLFPSPLPILLAVLVAFVTFKDPRLGMPIGGAVIGFGLIFHLADLLFFSFLGAENVRIAVIVVFMALFIALPIVFNRYRSALAIDFGILAVVSLFSTQTYFLAIPLILASAVFFKKQVALTIVYYVLISVPLQILQYYKYTVLPILRVDWWLQPGASPPIFVPLNSILADLNASMSQFRLYDASKAVYTITGQLTWVPNIGGRTLTDALNQYRDSIPGMLMFVVIVAGLSLALIFFARLLVSGGSGSVADRLIPCFVATCAAAFFFIFLNALQTGLAYTADVSPGTMVFGILATLALTFPAVFMSNTPKETTTTSDINDRAQALLARLQVFENQLDNVKENIPVNVTSPDGKLLIIRDSLDDTLTKLAAHYYDPADLNQKFQELKKLGLDIDELELELNQILSQYQIFLTCQLANWIGKLKETGLNVTPLDNPEFQKEMTLDARIEAIKKILNDGRTLAKNVAEIAEPIYSIIRPLYDPSLPEKSGTIEFAMQKLEQKVEPWIAIEALDNGLNNWKKQYGAEISKSIYYLKNSLTPIINLPAQSDSLAPIIGNKMPTILGDAKKAATIKEAADKNALDVLNLITIHDLLDAFIDISKDVFSILNEALKNQEKSIEEMLPTNDYLWEKNVTLKDRMAEAVALLSNSKVKMNEVMENLPKFEGYLDECIQTLVLYNERKEFLLNYPVAKLTIEDLLKQKNTLVTQDLPFPTKYAAEYLRLFYLQNYNMFDFDKMNTVLTRKT